MNKPPVHVTEQMWIPELREDGVYLVAADDKTVVAKMCRPDRDSDLMIAGYIMGLQALKTRSETTDAHTDALLRGEPTVKEGNHS